MQTLETDADEKNYEYQAEFARNLIDALGLDDALDVCARNCWADSPSDRWTYELLPLIGTISRTGFLSPKSTRRWMRTLAA